MDDLESFIADIEGTAPEEHHSSRLVCKDCNVPLEEGEDGNFICPTCSAQAEGVLQLDETELHHDDQGRPVFGQRVRNQERIRRHHTDYGWAWSTDDAVDHILRLQIEALEQANLVPDFFRTALANMWLRFWIEYVAPYIKDSYEEDELIPINIKRKVKLRDIEVLVKARDKVMIPARLVSRGGGEKVTYRMFGSYYRRDNPENDSMPEDELEQACYQTDDNLSSCSSSSFNEAGLAANQLPSVVGEPTPMETCDTQPSGLNLDHMRINEQLDQNIQVQPNQGATVQQTTDNLEQSSSDSPAQPDESMQTHPDQIMNDSQDQIGQAYEVGVRPNTRNLSANSIEILTLNRTLAFIEATARCMKQNDPLFAADIIRACNQRLIPFYGASKLLPPGMNLNALDKLMFQKTRPPSPIQLTRTASLLIHKVYKDKLPKRLPTPDLSTILGRFIKDLNLPYELYLHIKDEYKFSDFSQTRPLLFKAGSYERLPQYDRWAFAVLLYHMKQLFNLSDTYLNLISDSAQTESRAENEFYFDISSWLRQLSLRLSLIFSYDAFVLYHPMADVRKLEGTPQMSKYIETILDDRASATIRRAKPNAPNFDETFRKEIGDFINRQVATPGLADNPIIADEELDKSPRVKMPLTDAIERTQRFWIKELEMDEEASNLVHKNFHTAKLLLPDSVPSWSIYDQGVTLTRWKLKISPKWPFAYRQLLDAGGFLCFCDPVELMNEVRLVEERFLPQSKMVRRMNSAREKEQADSKTA